ncbi:MAG: glycosyltransferase family 4 protein [Actinomycetota bacterium]|nr:glycosyltransferase family 4 protein [Actinomycetota bacterium]
MKILLWHGYLLTGSGSNLYTSNIARVWRAAGHDVLLMCQQGDLTDLPYIDAAGLFSADNSTIDLDGTGAERSAGRCAVARPNIGDILPVYVYDEYEGFTAKRFVDLTDDELTHYTSANVTAMKTAIELHRPDAIITGHEVMGPYIARQACGATGTSYIAKLHGSALEYAVKEQERYLHFAEEGLSGAKVVTGGSRYMVEEAARYIPGWRESAAVVNPGCDVNLFKPFESKRGPPVVGYVGKFIAAKGVHNFLMALGLVAGSFRVTIVGYGGFERELKDLWGAIGRADAGALEAIAREGEGKPLEDALAFLQGDGADESYFRRAAEVDLEFAGRLDHGPLAKVLPGFFALVIPSVVPEAFGMVAAEAAASGVLPVVPRHSGIGEVGGVLEEALQAPGLLTYDPATPIEGIAAALERVLGIEDETRGRMEATAVATARRLWSWEHVADQLLAHALER